MKSERQRSHTGGLPHAKCPVVAVTWAFSVSAPSPLLARLWVITFCGICNSKNLWLVQYLHIPQRKCSGVGSTWSVVNLFGLLPGSLVPSSLTGPCLLPLLPPPPRPPAPSVIPRHLVVWVFLNEACVLYLPRDVNFGPASAGLLPLRWDEIMAADTGMRSGPAGTTRHCRSRR